VFAPDDFVFAWAIGKALVIVAVSLGTMVYATWQAVAGQSGNGTQVGTPKDNSLK
jgi:hypothetical protein